MDDIDHYCENRVEVDGVGVWLSGEAGAVENKAHNVLHHYYYRLIKQGVVRQ